MKKLSKILRKLQAGAAKVKDVFTNIKFPNKCEIINQYIREFGGNKDKKFNCFPVAKDECLNKSLILDGNKTLVALYLSWQKGIKIPNCRSVWEGSERDCY